MVTSGSDTTSPSLLVRVARQPTDDAAWQDFVERYGPRIRACCLAFALQPADAEDVAQSILLKLVKSLRTFDYDPSGSFRRWLGVVCHNALVDFLDERRASDRGGATGWMVLEHAVARESIAHEVLSEFDRERLDVALERVRQRVPRSQWEAFRLTALDGLSGAEAAAKLGMPVATVFTAKSKVRHLVRKLLHDGESTSGPPPG